MSSQVMKLFWYRYGENCSRMAEMVKSEEGQKDLTKRFSWTHQVPWRMPRVIRK